LSRGRKKDKKKGVGARKNFSPRDYTPGRIKGQERTRAVSKKAHRG